MKKIIHYFEESKIDKSNKKFDISFIGGPSYSVDTKLGLGLMASGLYRIDKENLTLAPSNVSIYTNFTTSGFFSVGIDNHTIFPNDQYRIDLDTYFAYMPNLYFGRGYEAGANEKSSKFDEYRLSFKADFTTKVLPNTYVGATVTAKNIKGKNFEDSSLQPNESLSNTIIGGGYILSYDSRDFIPNPSKGILLKLEQSFYPKALGSIQSFNKIDVSARAYQQIWKGGILAFDLNGIFNNGNTPWNMLSMLGGSRQMRGYYTGMYRDKKQINSQIELRQKVYRRNGVVTWVGAGSVFDSFNHWDWKHVLPSYGIGYRWEFKKRVNVRIDYGFGKGQSGFYFNINEAF
ncbi:BamA/TamA family outer membrane protein [Elizabethkingia sp. JS20170427COW]|uniref:BamA/TamA family outer membrane protein n=1 Tax=Elizabethkingia sp. JS20170427COW TaxID=2583851 RepID=UPI00210560D8|nr:BamA/TamA family outer membrane protein [Elizabethkingia sp. JS20170427COW]